MTRKLGWLARFGVTFALGLAFAGASVAQTTTSATVNARKFEVISVDGNQLVFRDERGTNELTVPEGFRFTVDGKQLAIGDLKPGMKGTAVVTTTTTVTPVTITEIKKGVVLSVGPSSVIVKDDGDGVRKRFTQSQLNDRGIKIINKDGKVTHVSDVKQGDEIMATIVTPGPPVVVTEQDVQATLAQATPGATTPPAAAKTEAPATTPAAAPAASAEPAAPAPAMAASPAASAEPAATPPPTMAATPASAPAASSGMGTTGWVIIILLIAAALYFYSRRKKPQ